MCLCNYLLACCSPCLTIMFYFALTMLAWVERSEPLADFSPPFYGPYPLLFSLQRLFYFSFSTANLNKQSLGFSTLIFLFTLCSCLFSELSTLQMVITSCVLSYWFSILMSVFGTFFYWVEVLCPKSSVLILEWECFQTLHSFFSLAKL